MRYPEIPDTSLDAELARCVAETDEAAAAIAKHGKLPGLVVWRDDWLMEEAILRTDELTDQATEAAS